MRYQDGSRLLEVARDQDSSASCVSLEFVVLQEFFGVVSQMERYISWLVISE